MEINTNLVNNSWDNESGSEYSVSDEADEKGITEYDVSNSDWERKERQQMLEQQTTKETTHTINFDSRQATKIDNNYRLMFKNPFYNIVTFELKSAYIPSSGCYYNVHEYNNKLEWVEKNSQTGLRTWVYYVEIPPGKYSSDALASTIQTLMNDTNKISSYFLGGSDGGNANGNSSIFKVSVNPNTQQVTISLEQNTSTFHTDSFMFPFRTGKFSTTSIYETLGFTKEDTLWSPSYNYNESFSGIISDFDIGDTNRLVTTTSSNITEIHEGSFVSILSHGGAIEIDTTTIEAVTISGENRLVLLKDEVSMSGQAEFRIYPKEGRTHTSENPVCLSSPEYVDVHSPLSCPIRPISNNQKGDEQLISRVFIDTHRDTHTGSNTPKRYFHAISKLGFIDLYFTTYGSEKPIPIQATMKNQPFVFQFEITTIERTHENLANYTIE